MGKLVILNTDGVKIESETDQYPTLERLQSIVGGMIELVFVTYEGAEREMYINEEGKLHGLYLNRAATEVFHASHPHMVGRDVIVGPAVIVVDLVEPDGETYEDKLDDLGESPENRENEDVGDGHDD